MRPPLLIAAAVLIAGGALSSGCSCGAIIDDAAEPVVLVPERKPLGPFLKGQLHAHTSGSMDSSTPPEVVVRWYAERGYDFLVITDHNHLTRAPETPAMMVLAGVELTINLRSCEPPPLPQQQCLLHMNALVAERALTPEPWFPRRGSFRREALYGQELDEAHAMGAVAQLNHPNFHRAADADTIAALAARGLSLMEIANEAHDSENDGDAAHPSTEALWDEVLTRGARMFGTATDDAHDYFETTADERRFPEANTGDHGFVMVRAERTARSIREALARGDFYATTGLYFDRVEMSTEHVTIEVTSNQPAFFEAIGEDGKVLLAERTRTFSFAPGELDSSYVRVRAHDAAGRRAWTQPVFFDPR